MKESTSPAQIGDEDEHLSPTMADRAKRICDELGVSREEAILYLEGFLWDVDAAIEACRSQTLQLPSLTVKSSPGNEKSASEAPYTPKYMTNSRPSSNQSKNDLIKSFCEAAVGATVEEAVHYLERNDWDPNQAFNCFLDERRRTPSPMKNPQLAIGRSNSKSYRRGFSGDETSMAAAKSELMEEFFRRLPLSSEFEGYLTELQTRSSSSSAGEVDQTGSLEEGGGEHIPEARPLMASSQVKIQDIKESPSPAQIKEETLSPPMVSEESSEAQPSPKVSEESSEAQPSPKTPAQIREETLSPVEESTEAAWPMVTESSRSWNQLQDSPEQPSELNNKLIDLFLEAAGGVTRDDAIAYLRLCNWDVNQAVCCLIEEGPHEEETLHVQASHGSRNQGYLEEDETGSSSSSINADSKETGNVTTVAIPGIASSQVDENLKENAVEDSSTELSPVPMTTTIEIWMADGRSGTQTWIPFRSDETVRDIRNRIEALGQAANNRDYYLKSDTGVEYKDLNTTVHEITSASPGPTILHQLYST